MAIGFAAYTSSWKDYPGKMTLFVFLTCLLAATGGLCFGYNIGISGGLKSMKSFLKEFFPSVKWDEDKDKNLQNNDYCWFESRELTAVMSSVYLAALVASLFAATVTRVFGRKCSMLVGGTSFLVGSAINGAAVNLAMLIIGRILLGIGVGFINQSVLLYLSEMAPASLRGMLNIGFQLMVTIGILAANLINYGTDKIEKGWGWRVSLALGVVPAAIMTVGSYFLPDTPNSLIHRGQPEQARAMLCRIRGTPDVEEEYSDLVAACEASKLVKYPWRHILKRKYRPQLTMAIFIPLFQQLTGINVIMFYAGDLFRMLKLGGDESLMSAVITGLVNIFATFICIFSVDRAGRRLLFLTGGCAMVISLIVVGSLKWCVEKWNKPGFMVALICIYVVGFAWSWGPLGWLVPSEIFPLEIRSQGQSLSLSVNMLFTFLIAQAFMSMLCHMRFGLFYYFAGWVSVMTAFVYLLLPETKGVAIEQMMVIWKRHWFWKRFVQYEEVTAELIGNTGRSTDAT